MKNIFKIIGGIFATILLGAIGSGLWERVISPAIDFISTVSVKFVSSIYSGYLDSIYVKAAKDVPDLYTLKIPLLILIIVSAIIIFEVCDKSENTILSHFKELNRRTFYSWQGIVLGGAIFVVAFYSLIQVDYAENVKSYSHSSMEILRPFIGDENYLILKSQYLRIKSENDFTSYRKLLIEYSEKHSIDLPDFKQI
jgi:hypothetical protein